MFRYEDQPTTIKVCDIGSLNASIVPPRECHKPVVLNNAAFILVGHNDLSGQAASLGEDIGIDKKIRRSKEDHQH
ncbi:JAB domain-containing protein [Metabacillus fastidiosus]|uniref:JAB domain-containing protein n=1 Tax=Metabacillus fastidiosus TaxID=1458 RepID=UPI002E206151|nr:JAB domain-containing protein [Metabacillus fastidiosus]